MPRRLIALSVLLTIGNPPGLAHAQDDWPDTHLVEQVKDLSWRARLLVFSHGRPEDPIYHDPGFLERQDVWSCTILTTNEERYGYKTCRGLLERKVRGLDLNTVWPGLAFYWSYFDPQSGHFTPHYVEEAPRDAQGAMVAAFRTAYDIPHDRYQALLIGLDGGVKARWDAPPSPEEVFALIDRMPMRQQELRERESP